MRIIKNTGSDRVFDQLRHSLAPSCSLDIASPAKFSLFAFSELREVLDQLRHCRVVLPIGDRWDLGLTGSGLDRAFRSQLNLHWLARECAAWIERSVELRAASFPLPQSILVTGDAASLSDIAITGNCSFTTQGLGITPGNQFSLIQCSEKQDESALLRACFVVYVDCTTRFEPAKIVFLAKLQELAAAKPPALIYYLTLSKSSRTSATNWMKSASSNPLPASAIRRSGRSCTDSSETASSGPSIN